MKRPKPFRAGPKGVKWFLVKTPDDAPFTSKGSPRKGYAPGIYLEDISARKRR